jgi:hypothetical protein
MKLSRFSLSSLGLMSLLLISSLSWGDKIPRKQPSDYGDQDSQVALTTPAFTPINQDGVTLDLNSVFCNSCTPGDINNTTNLEYFFDITLSSGSALTSLTFGPGFDTSSLQSYGVVQFDSTIPGDPCNVGGSYACNIPISANASDFSTVESTLSCDVAGICTLNFTNFDFATLGGKPIVFAATTPFGVLTALNDPITGQPLTPSVTVNGKSVSVPEPNSMWFVGIAGLICLGLIARRQRMLPSATTC